MERTDPKYSAFIASVDPDHHSFIDHLHDYLMEQGFSADIHLPKVATSSPIRMINPNGSL